VGSDKGIPVRDGFGHVVKDGLTRDVVRAVNHLSGIELGTASMEFGVAPAAFSYFGLFPISPPDEGQPLWTHTNPYGNVSITRGVMIGADGKAQVTKYPSGGLPRKILTDIATEVALNVKRGSANPERVDLAPSLSGYSALLGKQRGGSTNKMVYDQFVATVKSQVTITAVQDEIRGGVAGKWLRSKTGPRIAEDLNLWFPTGATFEEFEPYVIVSPEFLALISNGHIVPVRRDILGMLVGKPMAFDIFMWLTSWIYYLHKSNTKEMFFGWGDLYSTFTHEYSRLDRFVAKWKQAFEEARRYYLDANIELMRGNRSRPGGILVKQSPLLINEKTAT
jgi:hypothetical protein